MANPEEVFDLTDPQGAQDFLSTVEKEYHFQCRGEKDTAGCHRLADFYEAFKNDYPAAKKLFQSNCEEGKFGHSCLKVGNYYLLGRAGARSIPDALKFFTLGCQNENGPSCHSASRIHQKQKEFVKARDLLERGCGLEDMESCHALSALYLSGREGVPQDMEKAFQYALKSCEMGNLYSCSNVGIMYSKGDGVARNLELADKYKTKAMKMYHEANAIEEQIKFGQ